MKRLTSIALLILLCAGMLVAQTKTYTIPFTRDATGLIFVNAAINGSNERFIYDTGASGITINYPTYTKLKSQGLISDAEIVGTTQAMLANGSISTAYEVILRSVELGGFVMKSVPALIMTEQNAPMLLGQTILGQFGKVSVDYMQQEISLEYHGQTTTVSSSSLSEVKLIPCSTAQLSNANNIASGVLQNTAGIGSITWENNIPPPQAAVNNVRGGITIRYFANNDYNKALEIKNMLQSQLQVPANNIHVENMLPFFNYNAIPGYVEIWVK